MPRPQRLMHPFGDDFSCGLMTCGAGVVRWRGDTRPFLFLETMIQHPKGFVSRFVRIARWMVGVVESGGENRGADVSAIQRMTWLPPGPWPWCAAFVCWCYAASSLGFRCHGSRPDTPRAFGFEEWGRERAQVIANPSAVMVGDIVMFQFSHVGIVSAVYAGGRFSSIEGNTNSVGSREGDGVFIRDRALACVRSLVRLKEES